jgi:hypothetical protein
MLSSAVAVGLFYLAASVTPQPQLLVANQGNEGKCRAAPAGWIDSIPVSSATAKTVSDDLSRYFSGFSSQDSRILESAWHGLVRFCTASEEVEVLHSLASLVVHPPAATSMPDSTLPIGAEDLLSALAAPELVKQLESLPTVGGEDRARQRAALQVVRNRLHLK